MFIEPSDGWDHQRDAVPDRRLLPHRQELGRGHAGGHLRGGRDLLLGQRPRRLVPEDVSAARRHRLHRAAADGAENTGGHAFALVGYNRYGFIVQNSWGPRWGTKGFAILPYEDWIARGTDAWAVVLGAPIEHAESPHYHENEALSARASAGSGAIALAGPPVPAVSPAVAPWDRDNAYRHAVVMGNNGTLDQPQHRRGRRCRPSSTCVVEAPIEWCGTGPSRLLLYAHGGLNAEEESVKRIQVMAPYFQANGIYPIFFTWRTGVLESLSGHLRGHPSRASSRRAPSATSGAWSRTPSARRATAPSKWPARPPASRPSGRR